MDRLGAWLAILLAVVGALLAGHRYYTKREREALREAAEAHEEAIRAGDEASRNAAAAAIADIERGAAERALKPMPERVAAAAREAREWREQGQGR